MTEEQFTKASDIVGRISRIDNDLYNLKMLQELKDIDGGNFQFWQGMNLNIIKGSKIHDMLVTLIKDRSEALKLGLEKNRADLKKELASL
jgi:hypothetical protein